MEREIAPLVRGKGWHKRTLAGALRCYENEKAIVACAGIGGQAAARTAEAMIAAGLPRLLVSAGLAGALTPAGKIGQVICPAVIICSAKGAPVKFTPGPVIRGLVRAGVLLTGAGVAGGEAKRMLARQYQAEAIDTEAAAVAEIAAAHGVPFLAVKAISDEYDFPMPDLAPYISPQGKFSAGRFLLHVGLRPPLWQMVSKLASNSSKASSELCAVLRTLLDAGAGPAEDGAGAAGPGFRQSAQGKAGREQEHL
jgi:adenosylhomocysteine nucleosidase